MKNWYIGSSTDFLNLTAYYIYTNQFGFCNLHSTNHALIGITEKIRKAIDNGETPYDVFLDRQKAFDTDHETLLSKLEHYGIMEYHFNGLKLKPIRFH